MLAEHRYEDKDIRTLFTVFPRFLQPFITWLTGKPLPKQKPLFVLGPVFHFLTPMLMVLGGVALIIWLSSQTNNFYNFFIIPLIWLVILSGARKIALTVRHQCVHYEFTGIKKLDIFLAEVGTVVLCAQDAKTYQRDHAQLHHKLDLLGGPNDPHVKVLSKYGFKSGMSKQNLWNHLLKTLVSPSFHYHYTLDRIRYNFFIPSVNRIFLSLAFWGLFWLILIKYDVTFSQFFIAYVIPLVFLYNMSALLEIISEHPYVPYYSKTNPKKEEKLLEKTWAIMCGSTLPMAHLSGINRVLAWLVWGFKMVGHLMIRCTILCGDLSAHDLHHRKPGMYDWRISIYERQKEIEKNYSQGIIQYRDVWGFFNALDLVFESYSQVVECEESKGVLI